MTGSPPPQAVPKARHPSTGSSSTLNLPQASGSRMAASPMSFGNMAGISFANGGGFSFEGRPRSMKMGASGPAGSYGARFYGDGMSVDSPMIPPLGQSVTMEPSSFAASAAAFGLPGGMSSSYQRRSYAAAVLGSSSHPMALSTSFASMSFQPMSFGTSYSKSQIHHMMSGGGGGAADAEQTKGYECCGKIHDGLHALLEHVEDAHPFSDPDQPAAEPDRDAGFSPVTHAMELDLEGVDAALPATNNKQGSQAGSSRSSTSPAPVPNYPIPPSASSSKPATPLEQPAQITSLNISDVLKSPPDGPIVTTASLTRTASTCSSPADGTLATPSTSAHPSPVFAAPKIGPARTAGFLGNNTTPRQANQKRFDRAFNEVVAGSTPIQSLANGDKPQPTAVAPGVLFASAVSSLGLPTTPPVPGQKPAATPSSTTTPTNTTEVSDTTGLPTPAATPTADASGSKPLTSEPPLPQPSLFSTHKPWRCPNPGCNKAYKQSNGLRYHQQKGQCDFAIHDAVDLGLTVEEAEERSRPFVCAVGAGCNKRYRQMNGLKYHYLNSGEHGKYGLRMLQNGTHPQPPSVSAPPKRPSTGPTSAPSTPTMSATTSHATPTRPTTGAPYAIPNAAARAPIAHAHHQAPRMGTWPAKPPQSTGVRPMPMPPKPTGGLPPVQRGRDAVLFAVPSGGNDPLDVNGRLEI